MSEVLFRSFHYTYYHIPLALCAKLLSRVWLCDHVDCSPPGSPVHEESPDRNTGVGCHVPLQEPDLFPTQGLNTDLWHCRWIRHHLYQMWKREGQKLPTTFQGWLRAQNAPVAPTHPFQKDTQRLKRMDLQFIWISKPLEEWAVG